MGTHCLEVWGDLACFTRPEMKVERFSYPIITPSAARGIFDAIYWEGIRDGDKIRPYFRWQVRRIEVLAEPRYIALRRNEVKEKAPPDQTIRQWMRGEREPNPIWADATMEESGTGEKGRTQRQTMALKDVRYRICADLVPCARFADQRTKFDAVFERRAKKGQCFQQPYFGCREFPALFEWRDAVKSHEPSPCPWDADVGWMLYDVFDLGRDEVALTQVEPFVSFFDAKVVKGVLPVPDFTSEAVRKPPRN